MYLCVSVCEYVYVHVGAERVQKKMADSWGLELQVVVNCLN